MWFDPVLCPILTPDGHPQVQEINTESGICLHISTEAAECCDQLGLGSGGSGVRWVWAQAPKPQWQRSSLPPLAGLQGPEPRVISPTKASSLVPQSTGYGNFLGL